MLSRGYTALKSFLLSVCCILAVEAISAWPQPISRFERRLSIPSNSKVMLSNASSVSIGAWNKNELYVEAESSSGRFDQQEIKIESNNDVLNIVCQPEHPDERISLKLYAPDNSTVYVNTDGNKIEVKNPNGDVSFNILRESIEVTAPGYAMLDLKNIADAVQYPLEAQQLTTYRLVGHHTIGFGPPFVKFDQTSAPIAINKPSPQKLAEAAAAKLSPPLSLAPRPYQTDRPLSVAAQTIAARKSMMSDELRKSEPALKSLFDDKSAGSTDSKDASDDDIKLQSRLVNLALTVTDRDGRAITNLKPEDLKVFEDGVQQPIYHFSTEQTGFNLILLLDMSGSTQDKRELIKAAALHFISLINPADKVAVISFTTDVIVVSHLTQDRDALGVAIAGTSLPSGGTAFYDALGYVLVEELRNVRGQRNAVVVLTDGEDNSIAEDWVRRQGGVKIDPMMPRLTGSFLTFDELLDGVKEADAMIYPIYLGHSYTQIINPHAGSSANQTTMSTQMDTDVANTAKKELLELADVSGGRVFDANRIEELKGVYEEVAAELRTVYYLAYTPTNQAADGKFRRIAVKVNNPADAVARTRKGYYAR